MLAGMKYCGKDQWIMPDSFNLLKTKLNLLYISNQSIPRSKHFSTRL